MVMVFMMRLVVIVIVFLMMLIVVVFLMMFIHGILSFMINRTG